MTEEIEEIARRLVVDRKRDGRAVYDETAKAQLVAACRQPGASIAQLARQCEVNANQLSRWIREHDQRLRQPWPPHGCDSRPSAFVAVPIEPPLAEVSTVAVRAPGALNLQARLPNGVVVEVGDCQLQQLGELLGMLGEFAVFRLDPALKVYLHREPVDFRLGINGLAVLVEQALGLDPFAACVYVFGNRRRDRIKILGWQRNGFWLLAKRLEADRFAWPSLQAVPSVTVEQLHWLLDGIDLAVIHRHPHRRYASVA